MLNNLLNLSPELMSQAFLNLASEEKLPLPHQLQKLQDEEWFLLGVLLDHLLLDRGQTGGVRGVIA